MVIAMMWPLAAPTIGAVSRSSFRGWRTRLGMVCLATVTGQGVDGYRIALETLREKLA